MAKPNARTFRFSDETKLILEQFGNDFDGLVLECFCRLPEVKKEVERLEEEKQKLRSELRELYYKMSDVKSVRVMISNLESDTIELRNKIKELDIEKYIDVTQDE